jgi:hypothetical protein
MNICQRLFFCGLIVFCAVSQTYADQRTTETTLLPYPEKELAIPFNPDQHVISYALSQTNPTLAVLLSEKQNVHYKILLWNLRTNTLIKNLNLPAGYKPTEMLWHPIDDTLFTLTQNNNQYNILKISSETHWAFKKIYSSSEPLYRLVISPRPFSVAASTLKYRLFFGVLKNKDYVIQSVTEDGDILYQVAGNATAEVNKHLFPNTENYYPPSELSMTGNVLPAAFHPAGYPLAIENTEGCFDLAKYYKAWDKTTQPLYEHTLCKGTIAFLPNGLGISHWMPQQHGVDIYLDNGKTKKTYLEEMVFDSAPQLSPDAKGIAGLISQNNIETLVYKPISIPLGDVANAWMFVESQKDRELLAQHGGLFRSLKKSTEQLYQLYDSELYDCGNQYNDEIPTRPYMITTDVFWEVLAAAYEGTFILIEREKAIPHFWKFVSSAKDYYAKHDAHNPWFNVFSVIEAIKTKQPSDAVKKELDLITQAAGISPSTIFNGEKFNYAELKPRGHYQASPDLEAYFKAFKYLTLAAEAKNIDTNSLSSLPEPIAHEAILWIKSYLPFISAYTRAPLTFGNSLTQLPPYAYEIHDKSRPFPLSWGFDNEILLRSVFHEKWPLEKQITGKEGPRLVPSSLDVASALGSSLAMSILENRGEFKKYPTLKNTLSNLYELYNTQKSSLKPKTIYDQWIETLAIQWADNIKNPLSPWGDDLWKVKRLQTGLASWTTLRHASVLVNERSAAECGEGGFESLFTQFPRGFVEADPNTFEAIAKLFDSISLIVNTVDVSALDSANTKGFDEDRDTKLDKTVKAGILRRLKAMKESCEQFADMALREQKGELLQDDEYKSILYVGRTIEHNFLVFKSLAKNDFALSNPEPVAKVADVAGGGEDVPYLMAAVGAPLEWDFAYPMMGRKMIGKGAVYSFYEFTSDKLWDDNSWRRELNHTNAPDWIKLYMSEKIASCPAKSSV